MKQTQDKAQTIRYIQHLQKLDRQQPTTFTELDKKGEQELFELKKRLEAQGR